MKKLINELLENFKGCVYTLKINKNDNWFIDKWTLKESLKRESVYTVSRDQCSCLSWLKTCHCKHIDMLYREYERGNGIPIEIAIEQAKTAVSLFMKYYDSSDFLNPEQFDIDNNLPELVTNISISFTHDMDLDYIIHNITDLGDLIIFINGKMKTFALDSQKLI